MPVPEDRADDDHPARSIAVYCGSSFGTSPGYRAAAAELGNELAGRGIGLVFGGGSVGLMGVVADAVLAAGGAAHGVITRQLLDAELCHGGLTSLDVVDTMHERKARMTALADGIVCLPGGFGTLDEMFEALTWAQLGISAVPVVLLDVEQFWAPLFAATDAISAAGFVRPEQASLARRAPTVAEAIELALTPSPPTGPKWVDPPRP